MEPYIKKSALVAEIEKRINKEIQSCATDNCFGYSQGCVDSMRNILSFLNTLEVKEVRDEPVSNDLEEAAEEWDESFYRSDAFIAGAQWQKEHLWKDAQGDDLPEIDKEVIALIEAFGHYKVIFAHRVDENAEIHTSIDGKPLVLHPKRHGKGGWNIPDVKFWLDCELPKIKE